MSFFASYDVLDSLPDLSELLREMFEPVDDDQHRDVLEELDEFGEDVLYDGELPAVGVSAGSCENCGPWEYDPEDLEVIAVQKALLEQMLWWSDCCELSLDECYHIRCCQMEYLSALLCAGGSC